jgi:hypothetical protein
LEPFKLNFDIWICECIPGRYTFMQNGGENETTPDIFEVKPFYIYESNFKRVDILEFFDPFNL